MKTVFHDGAFTVSKLTAEEAKQYIGIPVGLTITNDMIRSVVENEEEKSIFEQTASGMSHIRIEKTAIEK